MKKAMIGSSYSLKTFILCNLLCLITGTVSFQNTGILYFTKLVAAVVGAVFVLELAAMRCVCTRYLTELSL